MSIGQREYIFRKFTNVVIVKTIMEKEITSYFVFLYRGVFFSLSNHTYIADTM